MRPETVEMILQMFRKEESIWYITMLDDNRKSVENKLTAVQTAEADFRRAMGV